MTDRFRLLVIAMTLLVAGATGFAVWSATSRAPQTTGSGTALVGGAFELTDQSGNRVTDDDFRGKLMLVYFGYTFCPDVCPTELLNVGQAMDLLGDDGADVVPLFITVDPERDTVELMADYVPSFHDRMIGLTGTPEEIAQVAKAYRVYFARVEPTEEGDPYLVDHSSLVYLMDRDGTYKQHFSFGTAPEKIAEAVRAAL